MADIDALLKKYNPGHAQSLEQPALSEKATAALSKYNPENKTVKEDSLSKIKDDNNAFKWEQLMAGGDALPEEQGKLSPAEQLTLGLVSAGNSGLGRIAKATVATNTVLTEGVNKVFGTSFVPPSQAGFNFAAPFENTQASIKERTNDGKRLSDIFGVNTVNTGEVVGDTAASFYLPGNKVGKATNYLTKIGQAALAGAKAGAVYGGSEAYKGDATDVLQSGAAGAGVGALFGGAAQGIAGAIKGVAKYAGNKWFAPSEASNTQAMGNLFTQIGQKASYLSDDAAIAGAEIKPLAAPKKGIGDVVTNAARDIYKSVDAEDTLVLKDLYGKAYKQNIDSNFIKAIKSDPKLDMTISGYRDKLQEGTDELSREWQLLNNSVLKNGQINRNANPESLRSWDIVKRRMSQDIKVDARQGMDESNNLLKQRRDQLSELLNSTSEDYRVATSISAENKLIKEAFDEIGLNKLTKTPTATYRKLNSMIFDPAMSPEAFKTLKDSFIKQNPEVWKSVLRETFESRTNKLAGVSGATPFDFMEAIMNRRGKANLVEEAMNFPGNEKMVMKFKALQKIYDHSIKPSTAEKIAGDIPGLSSIRHIKEDRINEFNKKAISFINNADNDVTFDSIMANKQLNENQKLNEIIKILLPNNIGTTERVITKAVTVEPGKVIGGYVSPNEDKK